MPSCNHDWTIQFHFVNGGQTFEIRPISLNLKLSRQQYDFCRAKLSSDVADHMKPHTRYKGGAMNGMLPADVLYNGVKIRRLVFRPDYIQYAGDEAILELHDLHESLSKGEIEESRRSAKLKEIYKFVVNRTSNELIPDITDENFTLPERQTREIYGKSAVSPHRVNQKHQKDEKKIRQKETAEIVNASQAIDFEKISPEKAIHKLNKKFRLKSWINNKGELMIGVPETAEIAHIAAPRDQRVWRLEDARVNHSREPIKSVFVYGAWEDVPGVEPNPLDWFDEGGTGDVRIASKAERTDINYGKEFTVEIPEAKKDSIDDIAKYILKEKMKEQKNGTVTIDPKLSGTQVSQPIDLLPGDILQTVPSDEGFPSPTVDSGEIGDQPVGVPSYCNLSVNNETHFVSEVTHNVSESGSWKIDAGVVMLPDIEIKTQTQYFDPDDGDWVPDNRIENEDIFDMFRLEGI